MKISTPKQMNEIDSYAINRLGIPGLQLMENAAANVVCEIVCMLNEKVDGEKMLFLTGKGNNGGDAYAAARLLAEKGACTQVFSTVHRSMLSGDVLLNSKLLDDIGICINEPDSSDYMLLFNKCLKDADLVVDGIFGTGFHGSPQGVAEELIRAVNNSNKRVLAIDIPSGINGENGNIAGVCIKADTTVTFCMPKIGLLTAPGCEYSGKIIVADIGIPKEAVDNAGINTFLITGELVRELLPQRISQSNKSNYGKALIVTGSKGMTGSGCLCARAAIRTGSGLVYAAVPGSLTDIYAAKLDEPIVISLADDNKGSLSLDAADQILELTDKMDVLAIGPGLSVSKDITALLKKVLISSKIPLVIDADGLNAVAEDSNIFEQCGTETVITPHPGEMSRLTGLTIESIQSDRISIARAYAVKWGITVVLKGFRTVVALSDGRVFINMTGNPGMATAGSGDVLTGIIVSLAGQGMKAQDAAILGVYLHGLAGDLAEGIKGMHGMTAGDIINELPAAIMRYTVQYKHQEVIWSTD